MANNSCVLEFNLELAREEVTLRRALFVTIIGTRPKVTGAQIVDEVAWCYCYGIGAGGISIHEGMLEDYLLILPDEDSAALVFNDGKVFRGPLFSLIFKRWSRFAHASSSIMSHLVDIEIRRIPVHAWSRSTAISILKDSCCILEVHQDTLMKTDLSSFAVRAWCFDPGRLHREMDLHIVEPGDALHEKRCLTYKIRMDVVLVEACPKSIVVRQMASALMMMKIAAAPTPNIDVRASPTNIGEGYIFALALSCRWAMADRRMRLGDLNRLQRVFTCARGSGSVTAVEGISTCAWGSGPVSAGWYREGRPISWAGSAFITLSRLRPVSREDG